MSLLFFDSFDHRNSAAVGAKSNGENGALLTSAGRSGTQGAWLASSALIRNFYGAGDHATFISGASVCFGTTGFYQQGGSLVFYSSRGSQELWLSARAGGILQVMRGSDDINSVIITGTPTGPGLLSSAESSPGAIQLGVRASVEMKATLSTYGNNTSGSLYVRVNGVVVIGLTNCKTRFTGNTTNPLTGTPYTTFDGVHWNANDGSEAFLDDWWVCNGADSGIAGAPNNDFLGDVYIKAIYPKAAGANSGLTPTPGGAHYINVNENPVAVPGTAPDLADYNESVTAEAKETYDYDDLNLPPGAIIYGVQAVPCVSLNQAGNYGFAHLCLRGGNLREGEIVAPTDVPVYFPKVYQSAPVDSPGTTFKSTNWTEAEVDASEFGIIVKALP